MWVTHSLLQNPLCLRSCDIILIIALRHLDHNARREYAEAVWFAPDLVAKESRVQDFLLAEENDPVRAAVRLALYWKVRKQAFGERWLLPMNQVSHGDATNVLTIQTTTTRNGMLTQLNVFLFLSDCAS